MLTKLFFDRLACAGCSPNIFLIVWLRQQITKLFFDYLACAKCSPNKKEDVPAVFYESNIFLQNTCDCSRFAGIIIVFQLENGFVHNKRFECLFFRILTSVRAVFVFVLQHFVSLLRRGKSPHLFLFGRRICFARNDSFDFEGAFLLRFVVGPHLYFGYDTNGNQLNSAYHQKQG